MSVIAEAVRHMMKAGMDADAIVAAIAAMEECVPETDTRTPRQKRNAKYYASKKSEKRLNSLNSDDSDDPSPSLDKENTPTPPKEIKPTPLPPAVVRARDFDTFWALFPNKVGKRTAEREFTFALQRASFDEIMAGLRRYVGKRDDRPWCNPSTFLHQDRWADQPASAPPRQNGHSPPNRKRNAVDAMEDIFREKGWTAENEPELVSSHNGDAECLPAERGRPSGTVVDLRPGTDWRAGSGH